MVHVVSPHSPMYPISFKGIQAWEQLLGGPFRLVKSKVPTSVLIVPVKPNGETKNEAATELKEDHSVPIFGTCLFCELIDISNERWYKELVWAN